MDLGGSWLWTWGSEPAEDLGVAGPVGRGWGLPLDLLRSFSVLFCLCCFKKRKEGRKE